MAWFTVPSRRRRETTDIPLLVIRRNRPALFLQLELVYGEHTEVIDRMALSGSARGRCWPTACMTVRPMTRGWSRRDGTSPDSTTPAGPAPRPSNGTRQPCRRRPAPPIRRIEELTPLQILTSPSGRTIVGLRAEHLRLGAHHGHRGTRPDGHAAARGAVDPRRRTGTETNRTVRATDRYTLAGTGSETWEPSFTFHGFRYAQIDGWPGDLHPDAVRAVVVHSDMTRTGWFETSDPAVDGNSWQGVQRLRVIWCQGSANWRPWAVGVRE